jgi:Spy/CpxP family protein refolding chaperone
MFAMKPIIACLAIFSTVALAQAPQRPDGPPPPIDVAKALNIDAARAQKVDAILKSAREKQRALREDTDRQLAAVLSPEELARLREAMPRPPRPGR